MFNLLSNQISKISKISNRGKNSTKSLTSRNVNKFSTEEKAINTEETYKDEEPINSTKNKNNNRNKNIGISIATNENNSKNLNKTDNKLPCISSRNYISDIRRWKSKNKNIFGENINLLKRIVEK